MQRYSETSDHVESISNTAIQQQQVLDDVGSSMHEIDSAAAELNASASALVTTVERIQESESALQTALEQR